MSVYRGGVGQWSWIFHRLTGVGVLLFLFVHILDTFLILLGPDHYNQFIAMYRMPVFRFLEVGLFAAVLYHSVNGLRITLFDCWVELTRLHRQMFYAQMIVFVVVMIPVTYLMLKPLWAH